MDVAPELAHRGGGAGLGHQGLHVGAALNDGAGQALHLGALVLAVGEAAQAQAAAGEEAALELAVEALGGDAEVLEGAAELLAGGDLVAAPALLAREGLRVETADLAAVPLARSE